MRRSSRALVVLVLLLTMAAQAIAGPHKVIVLPIDGDADLAIRTKLTASIQKLARVIDGQVRPGGTSFAETAAAVGCDPLTPECAETVRTTLGVDELVYGTATVQQGQVTVVVRRKVKDAPPRELGATLGIQDSPDRVEPALFPLFSGNGPIEPVKNPNVPDGKLPDGKLPDGQLPDGTRPDGSQPLPMPPPPSRGFAIAATAGGGLLVLVGLALWSSKSSLQDDIDNHPTDTVSDFRALRELEDKAGSRALTGNVLVFGGLALGGVGTWLLLRDRKPRRMTVTPTPVEGGATLTFTLVGGLR